MPGQPTGDEYLYAAFTSNEKDSGEEPSTWKYHSPHLSGCKCYFAVIFYLWKILDSDVTTKTQSQVWGMILSFLTKPSFAPFMISTYKDQACFTYINDYNRPIHSLWWICYKFFLLLVIQSPLVLQHKCLLPRVFKMSGGKQIIHSKFASVFSGKVVKGLHREGIWCMSCFISKCNHIFH